MPYRSVAVTQFQQNCSIVWCEKTRECAVIDPGGDVPRINGLLTQLALKPVAIWLTHGHLDHVGGTQALAKQYQIPVIGPHQADQYWLDGLPEQSRYFGFTHHDAFLPTQWLDQGDTLQVGEQRFEVRHAPGHTPGHIVFYQREQGIVFVGDVLFAGGVGRSDFPGGNQEQLFDSIRNQLYSLDDAVIVVPGHGSNTTIGQERRNNPYVRQPDRS